MANFITIFRVFLAFFAIYLLFAYEKSGSAYYVAFALTGIVFALDGVDGYVARKFKITSKLGATLDIMSDRIVEYTYWIVFACLGWLSVVFPLIVIVRGVVIDSIRSVASSYGHTAFGEDSMQKDPVAKFICCSKFMRVWYAVAKVAAFMLIILYNVPTMDYFVSQFYYVFSAIAVETAILLCVLRGLPVIFESKKLFKEAKNEVVDETKTDIESENL